MRDTELNDAKAAALYHVYHKGLEEGRFTSLSKAARYCIGQPAPRFYISARQASLVIGKIQAHISLIGLRSSQRRMMWQLWEDYRRWRREHPDSTASRERVLEHLVEQPAPEFYMTEEAARKMLRKMICKVRRLRGWGD